MTQGNPRNLSGISRDFMEFHTQCKAEAFNLLVNGGKGEKKFDRGNIKEVLNANPRRRWREWNIFKVACKEIQKLEFNQC